ncbi:MAG: hypothetical protein HPY69_08645 [Armatimonadetes bacterium]|nr:hypothetical protein [Armatimonadota bacterium]
MRMLPVMATAVGLGLALVGLADAQTQNLLLNPGFDFHSFANSRNASAQVYTAGYVAGWNTDAYGDITVTTAPHVPAIRPAVFVRNLVAIKPGKRLYQFMLLPEVGLRHGDRASLSVYGQQGAPDRLRATIRVLKVDSQSGTWKPSDFGCSDRREFPKHGRGELVTAAEQSATSGPEGAFLLKVEGCEIPGRVVQESVSGDDQINAIGLEVELRNVGQRDVWVYAPCLVRGPVALSGLPELRRLPTYYAGIPRTIRKLWRGEPIHILVMGSSIDRGSANPPLYPYDEDPTSPTFKQPLGDHDFDGRVVGRPDLTDTFGWWQHYFAWAGRLRVELLRKFDLTPDKICLNYMARDGSSISEAMTGLAEYCSLSVPCAPEANGQKAGKTWQELYPGLFQRPQGPGPDLILFGSGANIKTDEPDEGAVYEAAIRWVQQRYPDCEFLFCMWQRQRSYTANTGHLMELALNYRIPFLDLGDRMDQLSAYANNYALCTDGGHPQAAAHHVWFRTVEQAFEVADPIAMGEPQLHLPRRLYPTSYHWEGEVRTYSAGSPRLHGNMLVLDDSQVTTWAAVTEADAPETLVDGQKVRLTRNSPQRDLRSCSFTAGRFSLGDRHILELTGAHSRLIAADCRVCPGRQFIPVDSRQWDLGGRQPTDFASAWGAPYGTKQVLLATGPALQVDVVGTDLAVAWVDAPDGGSFRLLVDGQERLQVTANVPYQDASGQRHYLENRRAVRGLPYGVHRVRIEPLTGAVAILGLFAYDSRPSDEATRELTGLAAPGDVVQFTPPFRARPLIICTGGLELERDGVTPGQVIFGGAGPGQYRVVGE